MSWKNWWWAGGGRTTAGGTLPASSPQATRLNWLYDLSDGSIQSATFRQFHTAQSGFTTCRLVYANSYGLSGAPDPITIRASVETGNFNSDPTGASTTCTRVTFGGASSKTLAAGETVISDPVTVTVSAAAAYCTRTHVAVATLGQKWPTCIPLVAQYSATASYPWGYDPGSDKTGGGATTSGAGAASPCSPLAVLGEGANPIVVIVGDSIPTGYVENLSVNNPYGWPDWAFGSARSSYGCIRLTVPSMGAGGWAASPIGVHSLAVVAAVAAKNAICTLGINDLNNAHVTAATLQASLQAAWAALKAAGVTKVFQTTLTPVTTSIDNWSTTLNQVPFADEITRVAVNTWIRTTPAGCDGYFDLADVCESARNSGKWVATGAAFYATADGIHPIGPTLHQPMGQAIGLGGFV